MTSSVDGEASSVVFPPTCQAHALRSSDEGGVAEDIVLLVPVEDSAHSLGRTRPERLFQCPPPPKPVLREEPFERLLVLRVGRPVQLEAKTHPNEDAFTRS